MATLGDLKHDIFKLNDPVNRGPVAFPYELGASGVHEVCEMRYGNFPALLGFSLAAKKQKRGAILHVQQSIFGIEYGDILNAGAVGLQSRPNPVLSVFTRKQSDALWAIEEGIRSACVGLIISELEDCDFTASRRLVLASSRYGVPVILLMPYTRDGATAAATRWRIHPRLSSNNRFDPYGLGHARWHATLERSRQVPHYVGRSFDLEWNDETLSLTVVPGLASHTVKTRAQTIPASSATGRSAIR